MKKTLKILIPVVLAVAILFCSGWYLFSYDRDFTRDMLVTCARHCESNGYHTIGTWFYELAYAHAGNSDIVAIELAEQYRSSGNYTKAEFTLSNAIADGGGIDLYIALCKLYVEQDKLLDAVNMLNGITNPEIKAEIDAMRPTAPTATPEPGFYSQYISVTLVSDGNTIYVSTNGEYPTITEPAYADPLALGDGENNIYTLSIGENGLVSPLSIYGYTIGGVVEKMVFSDPAVETAVRKALGVDETKELYTNDLWTLTSFTMPAEATNYADLTHMIFLEELIIEGGYPAQINYVSALKHLNKLTIKNTAVSQDDLKLISELPQLKELYLPNTGLAGIAPLANAVSLTILDISNNTVIAIDAVSKMPELQEFYAHSNAINDLSALATATNLTKLDVSTNQIASLAPIGTLTNLTWVNASANAITQLGEIGNLKKLTYLNVGSNQLTTVGSISGCTALTELDISSNLITDITSLNALTALMYFNFSHNEVTALPKFTSESAIVTINGSYNKLSTLTPLGVLQHVNTVNMSYNTEISSVEALANCPVLMIVDVYATKVTEVSVLTNQSIKVYYNPVQ